jgi:hypothetical protein
LSTLDAAAFAACCSAADLCRIGLIHLGTMTKAESGAEICRSKIGLGRGRFLFYTAAIKWELIADRKTLKTKFHHNRKCFHATVNQMSHEYVPCLLLKFF